jgi:thioredoxin 1
LENLRLSGYYGEIVMQKTMFKTVGILILALVVMSMAGAASAYSSHAYNHMRGHNHNWNNVNSFTGNGNSCGNAYNGNSCGNACNGNSCGNAYNSNTGNANRCNGNTCKGNSCGNACNGNSCGNSRNGSSCGNTCNGSSCGNACSGNNGGNTGNGNSAGNTDNGNNGGNTGNGGASNEGSQENPTSPQENQGTSAVVEVTQLEQINTALQKGPVLLKIGAEWCEYCQQLKPVLNELATEYGGKATVMSIDVDQSPTLTDYFGVSSLPDSCVIVGTENGAYVYMQQNGKVTTDRSQARIVGFNDKQVYEKVLDLALQK